MFEHRENQDFYSVIRKSSFYLLVLRSITPLVSFFITIYIIRKLSVDAYGVYNILIAIMGYIGLLSSLGLPHIFQRYIPEFYQKKQLAKLKRLVDRGLFWRFVLICGFIVVLIIFAHPIERLFQFSEAIRYFAFFSVAIIFFLETRLLSLTFTSTFQHKYYVIIQISYVLFRAGLIYCLLFIGKELVGLLMAESAAYLFLFILQFYYFRKSFPVSRKKEEADLPIQRLIRFGGFSYLYEAGSEILAVSTDYFIISAFLGPASVAIYAFANRIMKLITRILPYSVLANIIRPVFFTKYSQNDDPENLNKMFNFLIKIMAFFSFPIVFAMFVLGDKIIIYIFDPRYINSLEVLWIVAIFYALNFLMNPVGLVLQSIEKVQILFYSKIFAIYNIIGDLLVVNKYGIIGIALVTGSAVLFQNIFSFVCARKYTRLILETKGLFKIILNSAVMAVMIFPFRNMVDSMWILIFFAIMGGCVYFVMSFFNKVFSVEERNIVNKILPKPLFVF